jgi:hypothetical protein
VNRGRPRRRKAHEAPPLRAESLLGHAKPRAIVVHDEEPGLAQFVQGTSEPGNLEHTTSELHHRGIDKGCFNERLAQGPKQLGVESPDAPGRDHRCDGVGQFRTLFAFRVSRNRFHESQYGC